MDYGKLLNKVVMTLISGEKSVCIPSVLFETHSWFAGGDAPAAEVLPGAGGPDEPDPIQASVVHHDWAVPHEVRVERQRAGHGGRANHHCHRLRRQRWVGVRVACICSGTVALVRFLPWWGSLASSHQQLPPRAGGRLAPVKAVAASHTSPVTFQLH